VLVAPELQQEPRLAVLELPQPVVLELPPLVEQQVPLLPLLSAQTLE
jgi:hypothetical protein